MQGVKNYYGYKDCLIKVRIRENIKGKIMDYSSLTEKCVGKQLIRIVLSKPVKPDMASQVKIRPVIVKEKLLFQVTKTTGSKKTNTCREVHENLNEKELMKFLAASVPADFLQGLFELDGEGYTVLANKKGTITVVKNKTVSVKKEPMTHNRTKNYLIPEGKPVPFMVDLGVMMPDGKVTKAKYDKFRQINRYLEFVDDVSDKFPTDREVTIIDFGCGKSYLTFALYYYLVKLKKINAHIIGLDLKPDVIDECNRLKKKYHYDTLEFIQGDIEHFEGVTKVDMVMSLHACDTATDYSLFKAIKWDADIIMAVPCCQHEMNKHINAPELNGITHYGILKERLSSIVTDAIRANVLEEAGYDTQILEFIDMDHTPKNLLIRAVKAQKAKASSRAHYNDKLNEICNAGITLQQLLKTE